MNIQVARVRYRPDTVIEFVEMDPDIERDVAAIEQLLANTVCGAVYQALARKMMDNIRAIEVEEQRMLTDWLRRPDAELE
jgi:hypothetical protein